MDMSGLSPGVGHGGGPDQAARMDELSRMLSESTGPGQVRTIALSSRRTCTRIRKYSLHMSHLFFGWAVGTLFF